MDSDLNNKLYQYNDDGDDNDINIILSFLTSYVKLMSKLVLFPKIIV